MYSNRLLGCIFKLLQKSKTFGQKFLKFRTSINLPWGHVKSNTKCEPDGFSRFAVHWIQLQTKKLNFEIRSIHKPSLGSFKVPQKIWARSFQPCWRILDTNRQSCKVYIYIYIYTGWDGWVNWRCKVWSARIKIRIQTGYHRAKEVRTEQGKQNV